MYPVFGIGELTVAISELDLNLGDQVSNKFSKTRNVNDVNNNLRFRVKFRTD
jgi:hypothetical protein